MQGKRKDQTDYSTRVTAVFLFLAVLTIVIFEIFSKIQN
jgi:hypothetical protein